MTRLFLLLVVAVLMGSGSAWAASDNPFGFETHKHPLDYEYCKANLDTFRGHGYDCRTAPRPHPDLPDYRLKFVDGVGLCQIVASKNKLSTSDAQDLRTALTSQISRKYGPATIPTGEVEMSGPGWTFKKYVWLPPAGSEGVGEVNEIRLHVLEGVSEEQQKNLAIVKVFLNTNPTCETRIDEKAERAF